MTIRRVLNDYTVTHKDRMFLVKNGVPYDQALSMGEAEVLRMASEFLSLSNGDYQHPFDRREVDQQTTRTKLTEAAERVWPIPPNDIDFNVVRDALQDVSSSYIQMSGETVHSPNGVHAMVYHSDGKISVTVKGGGVTVL